MATPGTRHQCLIYEGSPSRKLPLLAAIAKQKLKEGYRCLYLNSAPMVAGMGSKLAALGVSVKSEIDKGSLVLSSEPVSKQGDFNSEVMLARLEDALDAALIDGYTGLWASGDMTWEFGSRQDFSKLMDYELKLEELFRKRSELCGVCQYHRDTLPRDVMRQGLLVHKNLVVSDTISRINPLYLQSSWPPDARTTRELDETIAALCDV